MIFLFHANFNLLCNWEISLYFLKVLYWANEMIIVSQSKLFNCYRNNCFFYVTLPPRHQCQFSIIRVVPKYLDQTVVDFSVYPVGNSQTRCLWWEVTQSRYHVNLKWNFVLKNNSMGVFSGHITRRINVLYELRLKWTWHHSKLAVEEVSFFRRLRVVPLQLLYLYAMQQSALRNWVSCSYDYLAYEPL